MLTTQNRDAMDDFVKRCIFIPDLNRVLQFLSLCFSHLQCFEN